MENFWWIIFVSSYPGWTAGNAANTSTQGSDNRQRIFLTTPAIIMERETIAGKQKGNTVETLSLKLKTKPEKIQIIEMLSYFSVTLV